MSFKNLSEPCQKAILCHEFLHVRRCDWILIVVEEFVGSLFWFHPGVWWLLNRIHRSREQAVDYEVVRLTGNKQPYLDSLLEFARAHGRPRAVPALLFLKESHLVQRVALLLKEVSMSRSRLAVSIISLSILLIGTVRFAAGWFPLTGAPLPAQEQRSDSQVKAPQRTPIRVGGNVMESKLIYRVDPIYPEQAKSIGLQGIVKLTIIVNEEGFVHELRAVEGNNPILEEAAINAVKQWQYSPTLLNGEPVPAQTTVTVVFNLK
jgi:TonB family protein